MLWFVWKYVKHNMHTFLYQRNEKKVFFLSSLCYNMDKKKKISNHKSNVLLLVCCLLFPYQPTWTCIEGEPSNSPTHSDWRQKQLSSCYMSQETIQPRPTSRTLDSIFTEVDVWCVNRAAEPKQNKTFQLWPTCAFNLDTPSTPWAFFSVSLNCCHAADLETFFFFLKKYVLVLFVPVMVSFVCLFYLVYLLSGW